MGMDRERVFLIIHVLISYHIKTRCSSGKANSRYSDRGSDTFAPPPRRHRSRRPNRPLEGMIGHGRNRRFCSCSARSGARGPLCLTACGIGSEILDCCCLVNLGSLRVVVLLVCSIGILDAPAPVFVVVGRTVALLD